MELIKQVLLVFLFVIIVQIAVAETYTCDSQNSCELALDNTDLTKLEINSSINISGNFLLLSVPNLRVDCNDNSIMGNGSGTAFMLDGDYQEITNCKITNFEIGLELYSNNNYINMTDFTTNENGVKVWGTSNNTFHWDSFSQSLSKDIYFYAGSNNTITACAFDSTQGLQSSIYALYEKNLLIENGVFNLVNNIVIYFYGVENATIRNIEFNYFTDPQLNSRYGIQLWGGPNTRNKNINIYDNIFWNLPNFQLNVRYTDGLFVEDNLFGQGGPINIDIDNTNVQIHNNIFDSNRVNFNNIYNVPIDVSNNEFLTETTCQEVYDSNSGYVNNIQFSPFINNGNEYYCIDEDNDGFFFPDDCDDTNKNINPGIAEISGNGIDENCDGWDSECIKATNGMTVYNGLVFENYDDRYSPELGMPYDSVVPICKDDYFMPGQTSGATSAIWILDNDVIFDCAGSNFKGNHSSGQAVYITGKYPDYQNITLQNCNFDSYEYMVRILLSDSVKLKNNTFKNYDSYAILQFATNGFFENNLFSLGNKNIYAFYIQGLNQSFIKNSFDLVRGFYYNVESSIDSFLNITGNFFNNSSSGLLADTNDSTKIFLQKNIFQNSDVFSLIGSDSSKNTVFIEDNIFNNLSSYIYLGVGNYSLLRNNFTNSYDTLRIASATVAGSHIIKNNNFINTGNYNLQDFRSLENPLILKENYWGFTDCELIKQTILIPNRDYIYNPILDAPYPRGNVTQCIPDLDGDGYSSSEDCDDTDSNINPGMIEILNNDIDENCDGFDDCFGLINGMVINNGLIFKDISEISNPSNGVSYDGIINVCNINYYIPGKKDLNYAVGVWIKDSNVIFDCSGATMKGNYSYGHGINIPNDGLNYHNISIKNCNFQNYFIPISNYYGSDLKILNNSFLNYSGAGVSQIGTDGFFQNNLFSSNYEGVKSISISNVNQTIQNNYFEDFAEIDISEHNLDNSTIFIENNTFKNNDESNYPTSILISDNYGPLRLIIKNNYFEKVSNAIYSMTHIENNSLFSLIIENNVFNEFLTGVLLKHGNYIINNNTFYETPFSNSLNFQRSATGLKIIQNNNFLNSTPLFSSYNIQNFLNSSYHLNISNNYWNTVYCDKIDSRIVSPYSNNYFFNPILDAPYPFGKLIHCSLDVDQDGYFSSEDCDDTNSNINPGMIEILNNNVDENCDGLVENFTLYLEIGWNLVSLPMTGLINCSELNDIFDYEIIYQLNSNGDGWDACFSEMLGFSNLNFDLQKPFWIKTNHSELYSEEWLFLSYQTVNITLGWNLISYPWVEEKNINDIFNKSILDSISHIYEFNNGVWKLWVKDIPVNPLQTMKPGKAYWIYSNESFNATFNHGVFVKSILI